MLYTVIASLRNKFVNQFKIEVSLYLAASGATWEAIDTMSSLGFSACGKTVVDFQKKIQINHVIKIENHFLEKVSFYCLKERFRMYIRINLFLKILG